MKNLILFILSVLIFLFSCSPDDDLLTQEDLAPGQYLVGEDIWEFRCKVDGVDWYPTSKASSAFSGGLPFSVFHDGKGGGLSVSAHKADINGHIETSIYPSIPKIENSTVHNGRENSEYFVNWDASIENCKGFELSKSSDFISSLKLLDKENQKIIIEFELKGFNECGDSISITEGYLNASYTY